MRLSRTDIIATFFVAAAAVAYALWLFDVNVLGLGSARAVGAVILAFGFVASAAAVVPGFEKLMQSSRMYLVLTGGLGLLALVAGLIVLIAASEPWLAVLAVATMVLWAFATARHLLVQRHLPPAVPRGTGRPLAGSHR